MSCRAGTGRARVLAIGILLASASSSTLPPATQAEFAALEKKKLRHDQVQRWCIPTVGAEFVWRMEAILDLYAEAFDPTRPVVCFDEYALALTAPTRPAIPATPGQPRREDYEYARRGSCSLLVWFQPHAAWRTVAVTPQRTKAEFAAQLRTLADEHFPEAATIRVVLDNLNTRTLAALYEHFPAAQARRLARRIELCYTPKHASWLTMVELELALLTRQCLGRHLPDMATVQAEVAAWAAARNAAGLSVDWQFGVGDARRRLSRLYPLDPNSSDSL